MDLNFDRFVEMAYALGIGILIGLERAHEQQQGPTEAENPLEERAFMGVRTFAILALVGFISALLASQLPGLAVVTAGAAAVLVVLLYRRETKDPGITTELAAVGALGLGALCLISPHTAGVLALLITVMLACKRFTHRIVRRMRRIELTDTLKFLVVVLIVLPLLPDKALGPYGAFNPFKVGLLVVLISGIGFSGYFLTRLLGAERGLALTGLLGGLTSSTAVTAAMASRARTNSELQGPCVFAAVVANATMFGRVLVVVALLDADLALRLAAPVGAMLIVACGSLLFIRRRGPDGAPAAGSGPIDLTNPFSLGPAIKFALFFVAILLVAKSAQAHLGDRGLYLASLASGLADVDAITLTIAGQTASGGIARSVGALAIIMAVVSNSVVKVGIAAYAGGWRFGRVVGACLLSAAGSGLIVALVF